jgi:L-threonylcarbamoyladenylate synthase
VIISPATESYTRISEIIARGGLIAFRTDTFYGLGADPFNREAVQRIKQLKGREDQKPILIIVSDRAAVARFISAPTPNFSLLAETFWPGPLTLIGQAAQGVPEEISAGTKTVGVRLPGDDKVRALVRYCGGALTATSANPSQQRPATTAEKVFSYFGEAIDLILDDGESKANQPSTVIDVSGVEPRVIRDGAIAWSAIRKVLQKHTVKRI